ncbi:MAG: VOC family protein [Rhodobiaceae bacterium]|nr:VOC family protein [Rhodobiaceae bacterium]MCC0055963.1 VOC family protein [Rhodobiaceae bacterium]
MTSFFGPICQLGYVVADLDRAIDYLLKSMGCGPIFVAKHVAPVDFFYRGNASRPELSVAYTQSGPLQIEIIMQKNAAPSSWRDFLAEGPEGLQHVAYWTDRYDDLMKVAIETAGLEPEMTGTAGHHGASGERFTYFADSGPRGMMVELTEVLAPKRASYKRIADAARDWDGSDPVRDL